MPTTRILLLFAIIGLTVLSEIAARPQKRSVSGSIVVVNDDPGIKPRIGDSVTNYIEMKRTKLLRGQYSYTLGERITGDKLADQQEDNDDYPAARDVEASILYPSTGVGLTLTHINILVEQSSEDGKAYVVNGGLNQKFAEILIIANATTHYAHSGAFYGY